MGHLMPPLDSMGHSSYNDYHGGKYLGSEFKFAWLPQTCELSGKRIWLKYAYSLTIIYIIFNYYNDKNNLHNLWRNVGF